MSAASRGTPQRPRILVAHPSPDLYGSDRQLLESVDAFVTDGWAVTVVLPREGPLCAELVGRGARVQVHDFPVLRKAVLRPARLMRLLLNAPGATMRLRSFIRATTPRAVYVNTLTVPFWLAAARLAGVPAVCHVHEAEASLPKPARLLITAPLLLARGVIANSVATREVILGAVPQLARRTAVVYNGVADVGVPAPLRSQKRQDRLRLTMVSRLSPRKGVDVALEAVAALRAQRRHVRLDICGTAYTGYEWYERALLERAAQDDLAGAVTFHGYVHPTRPLLEASDAILVPSFGESFGNAAVEGLLAGRPVVASRVQALAEIITDGHTGLLVTPGSHEQLAQAIAQLADRPELARSLADAGRRDALRRFSIERYRAHLLHLFAPFRGRKASTRPRGER